MKPMRDFPMRARRVFSRALIFLRRVYLVPVWLYRKFISPLKPVSSCRFTPTCSRYAADAVMEWGIVVGTLMAVWRIMRCNPFSAGGDDPVPTRREVWEKLNLRRNSRRKN